MGACSGIDRSLDSSSVVQFPLSVVYADTAQKTTSHQVTTMLATSKNVLFPGHNHLLTIGADDPAFWLAPDYYLIIGILQYLSTIFLCQYYLPSEPS